MKPTLGIDHWLFPWFWDLEKVGSIPKPGGTPPIHLRSLGQLIFDFFTFWLNQVGLSKLNPPKNERNLLQGGQQQTSNELGLINMRSTLPPLWFRFELVLGSLWFDHHTPWKLSEHASF